MAQPRTPKGRARLTVERLAERYPGTAKELCALEHDGPFQLLAATILSAQSTDARVNMVTPLLFATYPDPESLAAANPEEVEEIIHSTGFFRSKTKSLIGMAAAVVERFDGEVPSRLEDLVTIPGVGRKTGNVVRSVDFDLPGLPVDTHVLRVSKRLALTEALSPAQQGDAVKVELDAQFDDPVGRAGDVQPADDPARAGDLRGPATPVCRLPVERLLPLCAVIRANSDFFPLFGQFAFGVLKSTKPEATILELEPVPATWFQKSRCWDPPPGRLAQCRPSGRHWCLQPLVTPLAQRWYYSGCYPRAHRHGEQAVGLPR